MIVIPPVCVSSDNICANGELTKGQSCTIWFSASNSTCTSNGNGIGGWGGRRAGTAAKVKPVAKTGTTTAAGADEAHERAIAVANVQVETKTLRAFNLEVQNAHTFFVDKDGVLVHNTKPKCRRQETEWRGTF